MSDDKVTDDNAATVAVDQQSDNAWPKPGDEGYVIPDGTPQSVQQLADNKRAAADRAAAGSTVHGAPMATPGPQVLGEVAAAQARAENYSGPTIEEKDAGVTQSIREGLDAAAEQADKDAASQQPDTTTSTKAPSGDKQRTADQTTPKTSR